MNRSFLLIVILIQSISSLHGQSTIVSGTIIDSESKIGLLYANIMVLNNPVGTSSDPGGSFRLLIPDSLFNDTLVLSCIGYIPKKLSLSKLVADTITLEPLTYDIEEISVTANIISYKPVTLNKFRNKDCGLRYSTDPFKGRGMLNIPYRPEEPSIEAQYFSPSQLIEGQKPIREVWVFLKNLKDSPSRSRLRIFSSDSSKAPDKDLLKNPIELIVNSNQLTKVNIEEHNIYIPENGLFIGVELLIIPENSHTVHNEIGDSAIVYSPFLKYFPTNKADNSFWLYTSGKWKEITQPVPDYTRRIKSLFYKPAISIIL